MEIKENPWFLCLLNNLKCSYENLDKLLNGLQGGILLVDLLWVTAFTNSIVLNLLYKYNLPSLYVNLEEKKNIRTWDHFTRYTSLSTR